MLVSHTLYIKTRHLIATGAYTCNTNTKEAKTGGLRQATGQIGLLRETWYKNKNIVFGAS